MGLYFGFLKIFTNLLIKIFRGNIFITNIVSFIFWLSFGGIFAYLSVMLYNYTFCWFGLLGMFIGLFLVQFGVGFFFTKLITLIYNKFKKNQLEKETNGK